MITHADINERVALWGLREDVVEKDYVLGWVLWGIGSDPELSTTWVFKGGTCLKKCYIETYRFSEDLDFTVLEEGPADGDEVITALTRVLDRVGQESGIDFSVRAPVCHTRIAGRASEARIYYRGPRQAPTEASIKFDLTKEESVVRPPVLRPIAHGYPDALPAPAEVRCYGFEEVFAEKLRAMGERSRPRDLYDIINLYWRRDFRAHASLIRSTLHDKCVAKGVAVPTFESIRDSPMFDDLRTEWANMLAHQLQALPEFEQFWGQLPNLFAWLNGEAEPDLAPLPLEGTEQEWVPPPTFWTSGMGNRLEPIRFAAVNRLLVDLAYDGQHRLIEPYSLRQTRDGNIVLHAIRADSGAHRSYRVDRIQGVVATTTPFTPRYAIEFIPTGTILAAPSVARTPTPHIGATRRVTTRRTGPTYTIMCPSCSKRFRRRKADTRLRAHKDPTGTWNCSSRRGYVEGYG